VNVPFVLLVLVSTDKGFKGFEFFVIQPPAVADCFCHVYRVSHVFFSLKFCHTLKTVYGNNHTGAVTNKHSVITMSHTMFARPATASKNGSFI
jgi:hypothetical protein